MTANGRVYGALHNKVIKFINQKQVYYENKEQKY